MIKKKGIVALGLVLLFGIAALAYNYVYRSQHRNVHAEKASINIKASAVAKVFRSDLLKANTAYLNKVILVSGTVTAIDGKAIILDSVVNCVMSTSSLPKSGQPCSVKGRVVGYDDFLEELKLDECSIIP